MAKQSNILGALSGKLGNLVGTTWRGMAVLRTRPSYKRKRKFSPAQQAQRAKFAMASTFMREFKPLIEKSYEQVQGKTGMNTAIGHTLNHAIQGDYPAYSIDHGSVLVAKGTLKNVGDAVVESTGSGALSFSWTDNTGTGNASSNDSAIFVAWQKELNALIFTTEGVARSKGQGLLDTRFLQGEELHCWISFQSKDGEKKADSMYVGTVRV